MSNDKDEVQKYFKIPEDCELAELKKTIVNLEKTLEEAKYKLNELESKQQNNKNTRVKAIELKYVRNCDFVDENHYLYKYIDTKDNWTIGYYRPEVCYNRIGERISREELEDMLRKINN